MAEARNRLRPDTLYLTVNKRLAAALRQAHDEAQHAAGLTVWPSLDVLPWGAWLQRSYTELIDSGHASDELLTHHQELVLWEDIIHRYDAVTLLRPGAAAQLAAEAFTLCADWLLDIEAVAATAGQDTRIYARWHSAFTRELRRRQLIPRATLPLHIQTAIEQGLLQPPRAIRIAGFDHLSPAQQRLFGTLKEWGCTIERHESRNDQAERQVFAANDDEHEVRAAARWTSQTLKAQPGASLAVIVPALGARKKTIRRLFTQELAPARYLGDDNAPVPFNLSLGDPLSERPLVMHALLACRIAGGSLSLNEFGVLLRSPFIDGHAGEAQRRALFDVALRAERRPTVDLGYAIAQLRRRDEHDPAACPDLLARLQSVAEDRPSTRSTRRPSAWADVLRDLLKTWGWPGGHGLDSAEYQQYQRFVALFDELASIGKVRQLLSYHDALALLSKLATDTVFQPQSGHAAVQIMGPLEAAGMAFDGVWLLGLDNRQWPAAPQPHPLLPAALQREQGMPHASAERELDFAASLLSQFATATPQLIASYSMRIDDQEATPSPLIADWPRHDASEHFGDAIAPLRLSCDDPGTWRPMPSPTASHAPTNAQGGAAMLAAQAGCPFAAAARYRLRARPLDEPLFAPDAATIGSLVHQLLQRVWQRLENSQQLAQFSPEALAKLTRPLAAALLDDMARHRPDLFTPRFRELEGARLTALLCEWLATEKEREQSFEIVALERDQTVTIEGLNLATRADRIDRLADGTLAVIDYKTGRQVRYEGWFEPRLGEPQLPLYSLLCGSDVSAALLARVRTDGPGCRFAGISQDPDAGFGAAVTAPQQHDESLDWQRLRQHWHDGIHELAHEFAAGRSDPTPSPEACRYCELEGLCRIADRQRDFDD